MNPILQIALAIAALSALAIGLWWLGSRKSKVKIEPYVSSPSDELPADSPALALIFADWCGWCKKFEDDWTKIAAELKRDTPALAVVQFDQAREKDMVKKYGVSSFPTIVFLPRGASTQPNEAITFTGNRTVAEVVQFAKSKNDA